MGNESQLRDCEKSAPEQGACEQPQGAEIGLDLGGGIENGEHEANLVRLAMCLRYAERAITPRATGFRC